MDSPIICRVVIHYMGGEMPPLQKLMPVPDGPPPLPCVIDDLGPGVLVIDRYRFNAISGELIAECQIEENIVWSADRANSIYNDFVADGWGRAD